MQFSASSFMKVSLFIGLYLLVCVTGTQSLLAKGEPGFTVSQIPNTPILSVLCDGSILPSNTESIYHIVVEKRTKLRGGPVQVLASLSAKDGVVRLESERKDPTKPASKPGDNADSRSTSKNKVYVGGRYNQEDFRHTYLSVLYGIDNFGLPNNNVDISSTITFGCSISYSMKDWKVDTVNRYVTVNVTDFLTSRIKPKVSIAQADNEHTSYLAQDISTPETTSVKLSSSIARSTEQGAASSWLFFNTDMILLSTLAILVILLFTICAILLVGRCKSDTRQEQFQPHCKRRGPDGVSLAESYYRGSKYERQDSRALSTRPPSSIYSQSMVKDSRRHRLASEGTYITEDTGYGSAANTSVYYSQPFDEQGEVTPEKIPLESLDEHLAPI